VLRIISSSPGELEPVFDTILANATRICEAKFGLLHRYDNGLFHPAALVGAPPALADFVWQRGPFVAPAGGALQQITEAFPWNEVPRYLVRDRDGIYGGAAVTRRLRAMGIRDKPIAPGSPWQNTYAERLIGTIRRECLDHMIVFGEAHLRWILRKYAAYYNVSRIHRSLNKDAPFHRAIERVGAITSRPVLGGLHHQYCRI
jgi:Integrase core domain